MRRLRAKRRPRHRNAIPSCGVFRTVQRIHMWAPEFWAKALEHPRPGEHGRLDFARECCEFGGERLIEKHDPSHRADISRRNMFWKTYFCRRWGKPRRGARGCSEDSPMTRFGEDLIRALPPTDGRPVGDP